MLVSSLRLEGFASAIDAMLLDDTIATSTVRHSSPTAAFDEIGEVSIRHIRYDNRTAAMTTVINGTGRRTESEQRVLSRLHDGFDAFCCQSGTDSDREKGGVKGEVERFR